MSNDRILFRDGGGVDRVVSAAFPLPGVGSRLGVIKGTNAFAATSYGVGVAIGGLITIATGLPAGTLINLRRIAVGERQANVTTPQNLVALLFDANPAASTFTDNVAISLAAADADKVALSVTNSVTGNVTGGFYAFEMQAPANPRAIAVDASGNLYLGIASTTASFVFGAAGTLKWRLEYTY